jgi:hypothetical protein
MRYIFINILLFILIFGSLAAENVSKHLQNIELSPLELRGYELDIETASESSLRAWLQRLGLSDTGTSEDIQKILYEYYGIEESGIISEIDQTETVSIISADNLSLINTYGTIVILSGDVIIEITETETDNLYTIQAQKIVLNKSTNIVTASGSVNFMRINSDTREILDSFKCSKFSLSVNSWNGNISNMETTNNRENSSGDDVTFSLTGDSVYKSSKGVLILDNGIVSSAYENPHFSIHAGTITILNEGDWFADQAFLYIGRVPVFYLPFFFYPGVEFFFNPSFGFSPDRGAFLNTTTLIFGTLDETDIADTSFTTFLQIEEQAKSIVDGIQGTLLEMYFPESGILEWADETESSLAVSFDVYEQAGVAFGIDAKLNDLSFLQNINVKTFIALNPDSIKPIFRFLIEPVLKIDTSGFSLSLSLPFYSDKQVSTDYMQRKTQFELGDLTGSAQFPAASNKNSFVWNLKGSINPDFTFLKPVVDQLYVSNISSNIEWDIIQPYKYDISSIGLLTHSIKISGKLLTGNISNDNEFISSNESPNSDMITSLYEPSLAELTGNILSLKQDPEMMGRSTDRFIDIPGIDYPMVLPDKNIPIILADNEKVIDEYFQYQLSYSINNSGNIDIFFDDGEPQYQKLINRFDTNLLFSGNLFENGISIKNIVKPSGYIQQHSKISDSVINWDSFVDQDRARTKFLLNNEFNAGIPAFGISYILKTRLLTYNFVDTSYNLSTFEWNDDNVLQHTISASLPISILSSRLTVSVTLPPDNSRLNPKFDTKIGNIAASIFTSLSEDDEGLWQYDPLTFRVSYSAATNPFSGSLIAGYDYSTLSLTQNIFTPLTLQPNLTFKISDTCRLSQKLFFDFGGNTLEQGISRFDLGNTYTELLFLYDDTAAGGIGGIVPAKIKIFSDQTITELSFWKNRIILSADIISNWNYNFQNPSDNLLSVSFEFYIRIEEFLEISIVSKSRNSATHRYFDGSLNINIFEDLIKSFNFFNIEDRYDSNFNLSEIEMNITHFMKDWDLKFDYTGKIALNTENEYKWSPLASIYIVWKAVPEIDISASIEHDTITGIQ